MKRSLKHLNPMGAEEEKELLKKAQSGCPQALNKVVRQWRPLTHGTAFRYCSILRHHKEDLVATANLGLVKAIRHYDADRGVMFSHYAAFWVRAYVWNYVAKNRRASGLPQTRTCRKVYHQLLKNLTKIRMRLGREATVAELTELLGGPEQDIEDVLQFLNGHDDEYEYSENEESNENPEFVVMEHERKEMTKKVIALAKEELTDREKYILDRRLFGKDQWSLEQIGKQIGLSRERVRQIESKAIRKVREHVTQNNIELY